MTDRDIARFMAKVSVDCESGCWLWTGAVGIGRGGDYARFMFRGKAVRGHRWSYEHFVAPVPDGSILRHTCFVKRCVNPNHVVPGTQSENMLDPDVPTTGTLRRFRCGHPRDASNTVERSDRKNGKCRTCKNAWSVTARRALV